MFVILFIVFSFHTFCFPYTFYSKIVVPKLRFFCPKGKFTCRDFTCISIVYRCDGHSDCPHDRSDEEGCRMFVLFWFNF